MMLIGAHAEVTDATNPYAIGLSGTISLETKNMLTINTERGVRMLPKLHCTWSINGVKVEGSTIHGHPYQRLTWK
ncbi:MAG: ribonuclease P protein subunit [Cenarchaeum sp. SB0662_bin_33]|nr:ribonuclease P protein subunit [Cenarchaeum sp. SB0664_bin_35]MYB46870.1 ribonuclease P protein subunit [Cenarchaeum sp. SB0662_bin_33]